MMARGGDVVLNWLRGESYGLRDEQADVAPGFACFESVEGMAGGDACLAAAALVKIDFEGELLAGSGRGGGQQAAVMFLQRGQLVPFVRAGETFHGAEVALLGEELVDERGAVGGGRRCGDGKGPPRFGRGTGAACCTR
jgi:hypothetical protein